uniref:LRR receptor-like serine/threonine-protein kinase n=1 Tax=Sedum alfredii TaxID=439688 RepID=A0A410N685_9MAGN|nr:LRR receptor-like serine/threonine-protein kinase [Sedum alfredii]
MDGRPTNFRFTLCLVTMILFRIQECISLNPEGHYLLEFRDSVSYDPHGVFSSWNSSDPDPCHWCGVHCTEGNVQALDLTGYSLEGTLTPLLGQLSHLRRLVLCENRFSGLIPSELGNLEILELLDLRNNNLSGEVPAEIRRMSSLKRLLLDGNDLQDSEKEKHREPLTLDQNLAASSESNDSETTELPNWFETSNPEIDGQKFCPSLQRSTVEPLATSDASRRLLGEYNNNLVAQLLSDLALPMSDAVILINVSSGAFPALENHPPQPMFWYHSYSDSTQLPTGSPPNDFLRKHLVILICGLILLIILCVVILWIIRRRVINATMSYASGLITTDVPKMKSSELDSICQHYVNILDSLPGCKVYKGTLPSGADIVVCATTISSIRDWSESAESAFRKQIRMLSRISHKNHVNLLGYCQEDSPFLRMMVFENAPNGTLYEHLHEKNEHLDWRTRLRIIMGVAYCLQHMHHELHPLVAHCCLQSKAIRLSDDYAAKVTEVGFWSEMLERAKIKDKEHDRFCDVEPTIDPKSNVLSFGLLLLEIISGKVPVEDEGSVGGWAAKHLEDKKKISYMIDPMLESFDDSELNTICEVIQECINPDTRQRPTMRQVTYKLREGLGISEEDASPKLAHEWWKELEILCVEAC